MHRPVTKKLNQRQGTARQGKASLFLTFPPVRSRGVQLAYVRTPLEYRDHHNRLFRLNSTTLCKNSPRLLTIPSLEHPLSLAHRTSPKRQLTNTSHISPYS
ncbi:hypothetical protein EYC84_009449 [Monilinia fructicola]|uniref:Uncharacterized protein n=1 Tax=Monilinia fructicola TaxID=38448 RepID=A0A5M9JA00_MONFR|nr:hypothetical protein EYC84_009449 [Monilinia fructicola]